MMDGVIEDNATRTTRVWESPPVLRQQPYDIAETARPGWHAALGVGNHERCEAEARPLRLLLAEPAQQLRRSMVKVLDRLRYEILTASDGFEVLCRLPEWRPDVLLMASELPRLAGTQVCSLLRDSPDFRALPIILLVDSDPFLDAAKAREAGADAYLQRPFRLAELTAALANISEQRSHEHWGGSSPGQHSVDEYRHSEKLPSTARSLEAASSPVRAG